MLVSLYIFFALVAYRNIATGVHPSRFCCHDNTYSIIARQHPGDPQPHPAQSAQPHHHPASTSDVQHAAEQQHRHGNAEPSVSTLPDNWVPELGCTHFDEHAACACPRVNPSHICSVSASAVPDDGSASWEWRDDCNQQSAWAAAGGAGAANVHPLSSCCCFPLVVQQAHCFHRYCGQFDSPEENRHLLNGPCLKGCLVAWLLSQHGTNLSAVMFLDPVDLCRQYLTLLDDGT